MKYSFDTSAFIRLYRDIGVNARIESDIEKNLGMLIEQGRILFHSTVYYEIDRKSKIKDKLAEWLTNYKDKAVKMTEKQGLYVKEISEKVPRLTDYNKEKEQADSWVIAMAKEADLVVVSMESTILPNKIPAACKEIGAKHYTLREFFSAEGWKFSLNTHY